MVCGPHRFNLVSIAYSPLFEPPMRSYGKNALTPHYNPLRLYQANPYADGPEMTYQQSLESSISDYDVSNLYDAMVASPNNPLAGYGARPQGYVLESAAAGAYKDAFASARQPYSIAPNHAALLPQSPYDFGSLEDMMKPSGREADEVLHDGGMPQTLYVFGSERPDEARQAPRAPDKNELEQRTDDLATDIMSSLQSLISQELANLGREEVAVSIRPQMLYAAQY